MKIEIGKKVKVVSAADDTCAMEFIGKKGIVVRHNANRQTGNTPKDPLHGVLFEDNKIESFWFEELKTLKS